MSRAPGSGAPRSDPSDPRRPGGGPPDGGLPRRSPPGADAAEHAIEVPRTARYLALGPEGADEVWIVLHGYGQLARRFLRRFTPLDDGSRRIVAPEALSRFYVGSEQGRHGPESVVGATWMTREAREDEIRDQVGYLDRLADREVTAGSALTVLGFSQGVATAARWAVLGRVRPARLVLWGDFLPPDLDPDLAKSRLSGIGLVLVRGDADGAVRSRRRAADEERQFAAAGLTPRRVSYAGGHDIEADTLLALATC